MSDNKMSPEDLSATSAAKLPAASEDAPSNGEPSPQQMTAAVKLITDNPAQNESRLLGRLLRALAEHKGEFRRAEIPASARQHSRSSLP